MLILSLCCIHFSHLCSLSPAERKRCRGLAGRVAIVSVSFFGFLRIDFSLVLFFFFFFSVYSHLCCLLDVLCGGRVQLNTPVLISDCLDYPCHITTPAKNPPGSYTYISFISLFSHPLSLALWRYEALKTGCAITAPATMLHPGSCVQSAHLPLSLSFCLSLSLSLELFSFDS